MSRIANVVGDQRELVRRAARVRQDLADLIEQLAPAADDAADALELARRQIAEDSVAQNLGVRDDRGERRAQVVRDVREELRLQRIARAQLRDLDGGFLELRLERVDARLGRRALERHRCGVHAIDSCHTVRLIRVTYFPSSILPNSPVPVASPSRVRRPPRCDSSSCWLLSNVQ